MHTRIGTYIWNIDLKYRDQQQFYFQAQFIRIKTEVIDRSVLNIKRVCQK